MRTARRSTRSRPPGCARSDPHAVSAFVDPANGVITLGNRSWPFDLDLRDETVTATIDVGGRPARLRPLRWREKLALARFAHLGRAFLDRQLVRACLLDGAAPVDGPDAEAVTALARWVNDPDGEDPALPLDQALLAEVTLRVCRALGVRPADLDTRGVAEVEQLWHVAGGARPAPAPAAPGEGDD